MAPLQDPGSPSNAVMEVDSVVPASSAFRPLHGQAAPYSSEPSRARRQPQHPQFTKVLTTDLTGCYRRVNPLFGYSPALNPRRVLTKPAEGVLNGGFDNADSDYILIVNDIIGNEGGNQYQILDMMGHGTFGQVVKCHNLRTGQLVAVKVIKNKPAYFQQSMVEVRVLDKLNHRSDPDDKHHIVRMIESLIFRQHLCLVFELLSINLYELIKQNNFRGLSSNLVKVFTNQILDCLCILHQAKVIHCDLKPENILLKSFNGTHLKVIDFGSACEEHKTLYTYIQSRFYRSPEVLLGIPYSAAIDMWSLGCICAELFLGLPIFPGASEYNQLSRITETLGMPPDEMLELGKNSRKYFNRIPMPNGRYEYQFKSLETYRAETGADEKPSKRYFEHTNLNTLVMTYPFKKLETQSQAQYEELRLREMQTRTAFLDFLFGCLRINPVERWTPMQARQHPFLTGTPFTGPFIPSSEVSGMRPRAPSSPVIPSSPAISGSQSGGLRATGKYGQPRDVQYRPLQNSAARRAYFESADHNIGASRVASLTTAAAANQPSSSSSSQSDHGDGPQHHADAAGVGDLSEPEPPSSAFARLFQRRH